MDRRKQGPGGPDGAEPGLPGGAESGPDALAGRRRAQYTPAERRQWVEAFAASGETQRVFCARHGLSTTTLCKWRRRYTARGAAGLETRPNPRNARGPKRGAYRPEERRQAVEAYRKAGRTRRDFARIWGVSTNTLSQWLRRYDQEGPRGLETRRPARGAKRPGKRAQAEQAEIARVKRRFPIFGIRKIRDFLVRFHGLRVSAARIRRTLKQEDLETPPPRRKTRRRPPRVRRFERARPGELWQSDLTSFVLTRHSRRVYLVAYLDDYSRYVVSWGLHVHQRQEMVLEALVGARGHPSRGVAGAPPADAGQDGALLGDGVAGILGAHAAAGPGGGAGASGALRGALQLLPAAPGDRRPGAGGPLLRGGGGAAQDAGGAAGAQRARAGAGGGAAHAGVFLRPGRGPAGLGARGEGTSGDPDAGRAASGGGDGGAGNRTAKGGARR
jgi:transposase-like protein